MPLRLFFFVLGMLLTALSVSMFFQTYFYPQVYDFFVKGVSEKFGFNRTKTKTCFDLSCLIVATIMTLLMFHCLVGVGVGTLIMACINGTIIGLFTKMFEKHFEFYAHSKKLERFFAL